MRWFWRALALAGVALLAFSVVRTLRFTTKQTASEPAALAAVDSQAAAERLAGALRFATVSHQEAARLDGEAFVALHRYLAREFPLLHAALELELVNEYTLLYTWRGSDSRAKPVLLASHTDVVPVEPGTERDWKYPPFAGRIAEGAVWGRGSMDDKVGVLAILEAVEQLLREGYRPAATVYLAFGHDEEVGGERGAKEVAALLRGRGVELEYVLDEGGALINGGIPGVAVPVATVGIAEKGSVSLELLVKGEGGHSSAPPPQTAVGVLSAAIHRLERNQMPGGLRGGARRFVEFVGPEMPFVYRLMLANLWLFRPLLEELLAASPAMNATLRTTTAATMIEGGVKENVLPGMARAVINFRILPGDSVQSVIDHVRRTLDDPRVEIRPLPGSAREPSPESRIDSAAFAVLQRSIRDVFPGVIVAPYLTIGGTDARHYAPLTDSVYRFLPLLAEPGDLPRIHGTDERVAVDNYVRIVQFYLQLIRRSGSPAPAAAPGAGATGR